MARVRTLRDAAARHDVRALAEAAASGGSAAAAFALVTAAADDVEHAHPFEAALLLVEASWYALHAYGSERSLEIARRAAALAQGAEGDVAAVVYSRLGDALQWCGRYTDAQHEWLRAAASGRSSDPHVLCAQANALLRAGDLGRARENAYAAAARARAAQAPAALRDALTYQTYAEVHLGLLREARASAEDVEAVARAWTNGDRVEALGLRAWVDALLGDEGRCRAGIAAAEARAADVALTPVSGLAAGMLALVLGRYPEAVSHLERRLAGVGSPVVALLSLRPFLDALVEACVRSGLDERARELVREAFDPATDTRQPRYLAVALRMRATISGALTDFAAALEQHRAWGNRFEEARTRLLYGEALRRERQRSDAREQLAAAASAFGALGAERWQLRARDELRAAGARLPRPASDVPLTAQEKRVATLVAEGLSNKEIARSLVVSTKTIEGHLRNIFTKLGVASRTQVARAISDDLRARP